MIEIWKLRAKAQEFMEGPQLWRRGEKLELRWDFETDSGDYAWDSIVFMGVHAYRFVEWKSCSVEQIRAFDTLVEFDPGDWPTRLDLSAADSRGFRIYFDDIGCYEILATTVDLTP